MSEKLLVDFEVGNNRVSGNWDGESGEIEWVGSTKGSEDLVTYISTVDPLMDELARVMVAIAFRVVSDNIPEGADE